MQTYQDAINALLNESVMLPPELLIQTQNFIEENKQLVYTTKEEFVRDAIHFRLTWLKGDNECLEIPREKYEKLDEAITGFHCLATQANLQLQSRPSTNNAGFYVRM
jgi:hypothetical protein